MWQWLIGPFCHGRDLHFLKAKVRDRDTIHFSADASNTELSFRTIHSANQLSIHGAVSSWCEEFGLKPNERDDLKSVTTKEHEQVLKEVKPQELNSFVQTPRMMIPYPETDCEKVFRTSKHIRKFARMRLGMYYKTAAAIGDGFWRSNSSMQRWKTPSCWGRFQNLCRNSRTNKNWTSSSSSYHTVSWHSWNWNSNCIHDNARSKFLCSHVQRKESLRRWVTSRRSRTQSHE